jgi:hypothetical protein
MEVVINCESKALIKDHGPNLIDAAEAHLEVFHARRKELHFRVSN